MSRRLAVRVFDGVVRYADALALQESLATARRASTVPDTLLVLQHDHVYTVGKRNTEHNILADPVRLAELGVEIHRTRRGGDVTYHGPGQTVLYPVVHLRESRLGARAYVEGLEDVMIAAAASFGVRAFGRVPEMTGVWVGDKKLGAVGVRVSGGVSTHGAAFNRDPDLRMFDDIVPCGLEGRAVTSLASELRERDEGDGGEKHTRAVRGVVEARLVEAFAEAFGYDDVELTRVPGDDPAGFSR